MTNRKTISHSPGQTQRLPKETPPKKLANTWHTYDGTRSKKNVDLPTINGIENVWWNGLRKKQRLKNQKQNSSSHWLSPKKDEMSFWHRQHSSWRQVRQDDGLNFKAAHYTFLFVCICMYMYIPTYISPIRLSVCQKGCTFGQKVCKTPPLYGVLSNNNNHFHTHSKHTHTLPEEAMKLFISSYTGWLSLDSKFARRRL